MTETRDINSPNPTDQGGDLPDRPEDVSGKDLGRLGEEGGPIGLRIGRDPSNLGDDVPGEGDVTHPDPIGNTPQM
jgi:hypothetical protein